MFSVALAIDALQIAPHISTQFSLIFSEPIVMIISNQLTMEQLIFDICVCGELP